MVRVRAVFSGTLLVGAVIVGVGSAVVACQQTLSDTVSIVTTTTVLAVQPNPAEAPAMTPVSYMALVGDGDGGVSVAPLQWDYCNARNPLSNQTPTNTGCQEPGDSQLALIGRGLRVSGGAAAIPTLACSNFGPNAPQAQAVDGGAEAGGPGRPVDPDSTGGFYQPVSVFLPEGAGIPPEITLYEMRISCGFSGADPTVSGALRAQYHLNVNPQVKSLTANGSPLHPDTASATNSPIGAGQTLTLEVSWPSCPVSDEPGDGVCGASESGMNTPSDCVAPPSCASVPLEGDAGQDGGAVSCIPPLYAANPGAGLSCPSDCENLVGGCPTGCEIPAGCPDECKNPQGCAGAERYVNLDLTTESLVYQREGIEVSWYATAGSFDHDSTGRQGTEDETTSDNGWTAPSKAGPVHVWVVLRDDRGGIGWAGYALDVGK